MAAYLCGQNVHCLAYSVLSGKCTTQTARASCRAPRRAEGFPESPIPSIKEYTLNDIRVQYDLGVLGSVSFEDFLNW